jgi:hypothetical protein
MHDIGILCGIPECESLLSIHVALNVNSSRQEAVDLADGSLANGIVCAYGHPMSGVIAKSSIREVPESEAWPKK